MPIWMLAVPLVALVALAKKRPGKTLVTGGSHVEETMDKEPDKSYGALDVLLESLGWRYTWGGYYDWEKARELGAAGKGVFDCSGFVCSALVKLGRWPSDLWGKPHHVTSSMAYDCDPVEWGKQVPGDIAFYPGHVMLVLSKPRADGDSEVIGASGGRSTTHGDDPNACVKIMHSAKYRSDFCTFMRPKKGSK